MLVGFLFDMNYHFFQIRQSITGAQNMVVHFDCTFNQENRFFAWTPVCVATVNVTFMFFFTIHVIQSQLGKCHYTELTTSVKKHRLYDLSFVFRSNYFMNVTVIVVLPISVVHFHNYFGWLYLATSTDKVLHKWICSLVTYQLWYGNNIIFGRRYLQPPIHEVSSIHLFILADTISRGRLKLAVRWMCLVRVEGLTMTFLCMLIMCFYCECYWICFTDGYHISVVFLLYWLLIFLKINCCCVNFRNDYNIDTVAEVMNS